MSVSHTIDHIIVGAGIAGLYTAWKLKQKDPKCTIVILEAGTFAGGRARTHQFGGQDVPMGAGIGRMRDTRLKRLLKDLGLASESRSYSKVVHVQDELQPYQDEWPVLWKRIQQGAHQFKNKGMRFEDACVSILGEVNAQRFIALSGYTDYLNADVMDVVRWYGMQDNAPTQHNQDRLFTVPWSYLIERLCDAVGRENIVMRCPVTRLGKNGSVESKDGREWRARQRVYLTVPGPQLRHLLPHHTPLRCLGHQPFIRVYAVLKRPISGLKGYTVVANELQKVIPMRADGTLVMIAYADNADARACWHAAARKDPTWFERRLNQAFHTGGIKILQMWHKYWSVGTHYFHAPVDIHALQHVSDTVKIVGEAVSHNQGWVEGALQSVDALI